MKPLLQALNGETPSRTPLWLMRQAGRYLPEYRAYREKHDTLSMFCTPSIAAPITLQPLQRYDLDAAILYADILLIPKELGLGLSFVAGEGPRFQHTIRSAEDFLKFESHWQDSEGVAEKLGYVYETVRLVKPQLSATQTFIGFAGAPWTVASYMIEGGGSGGALVESKKLMTRDPKMMHALLEALTQITICYLENQVKAGVEVLQLFESWGGALTPHQYREFALPYAEKILARLSQRVPCIHFVGESAGFVRHALDTSAQCFGLDWRQDLAEIVPLANDNKKAIQGNLDPLLLYSPLDVLQRETQRILEQSRALKYGYVFNLGHGITPATPLESVGRVVDTVHQFKG